MEPKTRGLDGPPLELSVGAGLDALPLDAEDSPHGAAEDLEALEEEGEVYAAELGQVGDVREPQQRAREPARQVDAHRRVVDLCTE